MSQSASGREIATQITFQINGKEFVEPLTYIGAGSNCIVYHTNEKHIIKEFSPLIGVMPIMKRETDRNSPFVLINTIGEDDQAVYRFRRNHFKNETRTIISFLENRYKKQSGNMFLVPRDIDVFAPSLADIQWCSYIGGETLETKVKRMREQKKDVQERFVSIFPHIIELFKEIAIYHGDVKHKNGILNLDIKPSNIYVINSESSEKSIGVRNLDFGSSWLIDDESRENLGIISSIRDYVSKNYQDVSDILYDEYESAEILEPVRLQFFGSSPGFYDKRRLNTTIRHCLDSTKSKEQIVGELKKLDLIAAWKTFLFAFVDSDELFADSYDSDDEFETDKIHRIFENVFRDNPLVTFNSGRYSLYKNFCIYTHLYRLMEEILDTRKWITSTEIVEKLTNVWSVLGGVIETEKTKSDQDFKDMCEIYSKKDHLLKQKGLETIEDIVNFCKANGLKRTKIGDLHWFLLLGKKHT